MCKNAKKDKVIKFKLIMNSNCIQSEKHSSKFSASTLWATKRCNFWLRMWGNRLEV